MDSFNMATEIRRSSSSTSIFSSGSAPPSRNSSPGPTPFKIIKTNLKDNILIMDNVVMKETYVLRRFTVTNNIPLTIKVKLSTDLNDQIKFQLENENLREISGDVTENIQSDEFNQLFNDVNLIDEIVMGPLQTVNVVVSFRPLANKIFEEEEGSDNEEEGTTSRPSTSNRNRIIEIRGNITLFASVIEVLPPDMPMVDFGDSEKQIVVKFVAKECRSIMKVNTNDITFEDCVMGTTYVKDLNIWNSSEIPLNFLISFEGGKEGIIEFYNHETGALITSSIQIPGFNHITIRISFKPLEVGEFKWKVTLENLDNSNNFDYVTINARVTAEFQQHVPIVTVNEKVNFGECYTSVPTSQLITIRNISPDPVDVHFRSDLPEHEVLFYLHNTESQEDQEKLLDESFDDDPVDKRVQVLGSAASNYPGSPKSPQSPPVTATTRSLARRNFNNRFPLSPISSNKQDDEEKEKILEHIEELTIYPGMQRIVEVRYRPSRQEESNAKAVKLHRHKFNIWLEVIDEKGRLREKKKISASARLCTSLIQVTKQLINMGDCNLGNKRNGFIEVTNLSDLPTDVALQYESKIVSFKKHRVHIPPKQTVDLLFEMVPRKVHPDYRKEITIINLNNKENDQFVEIRANNMDPYRVGAHSQYYRLTTPFSRNYLDFDSVAVNSSMVRTFSIKNITKDYLMFKLTTALPDEIKLYRQAKSTGVSQGSTVKRKEMLMKRMEDRESDSADQALGASSNENLLSPTPAKTPSKKRNLSVADGDFMIVADKESKEDPVISKSTSASILSDGAKGMMAQLSSSWNEKSFLLDRSIQVPERPPSSTGTSAPSEGLRDSTLSANVNSPPSTSKPGLDLSILSKPYSIQSAESVPILLNTKQEEEYIQTEVSRLELVEKAINEKLLVLAEGLALIPNEEVVIYAVLTPNGTKRPNIQGKLKKFDSKIWIELMHPPSLQDVKLEQPVRELLVTAKICRSMMDLAQKNINFGDIRLDDHKAKTLVINNLSEVPLVYRVRKTGSMASLDLKISKEDRTGIIRPYRNREVHFFFKPTLNEPYSERLIIENIYDRTNNQIVHVKANIFKPRTFYLSSLEVHFGCCLIGESSRTVSIAITNISKKKRSYTIVSDQSSFIYSTPEIIFKSERESSIEPSSEDEQSSRGNLSKISSHSLTFTLEAGVRQKIWSTIVFAPNNPIGEFPVQLEEGTGSILVYEAKNSDISKKILYTATSYYDSDVFKNRPFQEVNDSKSGVTGNAPTVPSPMMSPLVSAERSLQIEINPKAIDFGELPINTSVSSHFTITNITPNPLPFMIIEQMTLPPIESPALSKNDKSQWKTEGPSPLSRSGSSSMFAFSDTSGIIEPGGRFTVKLTCSPVYPGKQKHNIVIADDKGVVMGQVTVTVSPLKPRYIRFPNIENDVLDLGMCYIDSSKSYAKVVPLKIKSVCKQTVFITVQSNLANQVFIFQDRELTKPAVDLDADKKPGNFQEISLKPLFNTTVYVCLQPSTKSDTYSKGQCRNLVGGIRVKVYEAGSKGLLDEVFIKFTALVGKSILQLSSTFIDLGITRKIGQVFLGSFVVTNNTTELPTEFSILAPKSKYIQLSALSGKLDGSEMNGICTKEIKFKVKTESYGLIQESLIIKNFNAQDQQLELLIRLFVDENSLKTDLETIGNNVLTFNDIYLQSPSLASLDVKKTFLQLKSPPEYQCLTIENKTTQDIVLYPKTNLSLLVLWKDLNSDNSDNYDIKNKKDIHLCGKAFKLKAMSKSNVYVCFPATMSLTTGKLNILAQGKKASFNGILVFERELDITGTGNDDTEEDEQLMRASKLINVQGTYCISMGEIFPPSKNLGPVGYENGWKDVPFDFELKNLSETWLSTTVHTHNPALSIDDIHDDRIIVEPNQTKKISGVFSPSKMKSPPGPLQLEFRLVNTNNPLNKISLSLTAEVTAAALRFSRLDEGDLVLPPLIHPSETPADNWLVVDNSGDKPLEISMNLELAPSIAQFASAELLQRQSNSLLPSSGLAIGPSESLELLVRLRAKAEAKVPLEFITDNNIVIGTLSAVSTSGVIDTVTIKGSFKQGPTFVINPTRLHFDITSLEELIETTTPSQSKSFTISNSSSVFPISLSIQSISKIPEGLELEIEPQQLLLNPKNSQEIRVTLKSEEPVHLSESINIMILDKEYPRQAQTLSITMLGGVRSKQPRKNTSVSFHLSESSSSVPIEESSVITPLLALKGCTPLGNDMSRYEINLGQQLQGSNSVVWELIIENVSEGSYRSAPVEYKLYTVNKDDDNWMTLSKTGGVIEKVGEQHTISLNFSTKRLDTYTTYIIVENVSNPHNLKMVRVNFKVVATQNSYYSVLVDGKQTSQLTVDFGEVYYEQSYQDRYIIIVNDYSMPLDILLSTNLSSEDSTEVNFSLSRTSINLLNWITVDPMNSVRIFIHFRPSKDKSPTYQVSEDEEEISDPVKTTKEKNVEIYVSCSIVKDYQQVISLRSICKDPQMQVSSTNLVFAGQIAWKPRDLAAPSTRRGRDDDYLEDSDISFAKDQWSKQILISNNFTNHLEYILKNDSLFFNVEGANGGAVVSKYIPHLLTIKPNFPVIMKNKKFLLKEKYIEEHITIYNKNQLTERYWISLRLTLGHLIDFYSAPGPKVQYPFTTLESSIISFMKNFQIFWSETLSLQIIKTRRKDLTLKELISTLNPEEIDDEQLYFMYHYITDELVFFGLKKQAGKFAFQLSNLLFNTLFHSELFAALKDKSKLSKISAINYSKWVKRLGYFLGWFPEKRKALASLRGLEQEMMNSINNVMNT